MSGRLSRRAALSAAVALMPAAALPAVAKSGADDALIQLCARFLELDAAINDPSRTDAAKDAQNLPEWPEYLATETAITEAKPHTLAGMAAMVRVADHLGESAGEDWSDHGGLRIARALLDKLRDDGEVV